MSCYYSKEDLYLMAKSTANIINVFRKCIRCFEKDSVDKIK